MSKDDPKDNNRGGELVTDSVQDELQDKPTTSVAAGIKEAEEKIESSLGPIDEPLLGDELFESDNELELDPDEAEYTISDAQRQEIAEAEEERMREEQSRISTLPYQIHVTASKSDEPAPQSNSSASHSEAVNDDDIGNDEDDITKLVNELKSDGGLKQAVLFNALKSIMENRQNGHTDATYSFNSKDGARIHQNDLLSEDLSTHKLADVIDKSNGYSLYSQANDTESVFDLEFTQEGGENSKLPNATECVGLDLSVKNDVIDSLDKSNYHPAYNAVKMSIQTTVDEMLNKGLDIFDIEGNDELAGIFERTLKETAMRRNIDIHINKTADPKEVESTALDSEAATQELEDGVNNSVGWVAQQGGFDALSENDKDKARESYSKWVESNPEKNTFSLMEYVAYTQERHQERESYQGSGLNR